MSGWTTAPTGSGGRLCRDLWVCLCGTAAPTGLCKRWGGDEPRQARLRNSPHMGARAKRSGWARVHTMPSRAIASVGTHEILDWKQAWKGKLGYSSARLQLSLGSKRT